MMNIYSRNISRHEKKYIKKERVKLVINQNYLQD
jgi:hypothetical protein